MKLFIICCLIGVISAVEVHFENKDGGFFLKHTARWPGAGPPQELSTSTPPGTLLSLDRFTVLRTAQPVSVRATYGPFSTKQTVPARYGVPDPLEPTAPELKNGTSLINMKDANIAAPNRLDVSAHVVSRELTRDSPTLRVLFHAGSDANSRRTAVVRNYRVCISVHATFGTHTLSASCSPEGEEGACLAELAIPADWWPSDTKGKRPPRIVKLAYSAAESEIEVGIGCGNKATVQPTWALGVVTLIPARAGWREARAGDVALLLPRASLYPHSRFHVPFVVRKDAKPQISHVIVKMRVKAGLRILCVTPTNSHWNLMSEVKAKVATITATKKNQISDEDDNYDSGAWEEVFAILIEVGTEAGRGSARITWSAKHIQTRIPTWETTISPADVHPRITTRLDVEKDDIQAVLPISKNWEVLNTAVLTGSQVSQGMKVLIVSQAGQVADVTLQSTCHSEDESVLKVSSSCSSVYVDGSEIRGSSNASVIVKYSTYTGLARFTVWMPEFPLEVDVSDNRLSQIKGWKIPDDEITNSKIRMKRSYDHIWNAASEDTENSNNIGEESKACKLRYQQSPIEVFARFLATDHESGRVTYFVSRRTWLKVTDLVISLMRVSDPRIASLIGKTLQGASLGRTEVQVLSPITGRVIAAKEVRVVNDKVTVSRLTVRVISGLQLNISPDTAIENGYVSETTITRRLTAQYQEGLLDIGIEFSDGSKTPLRDMAVGDYYLLVESLDPEVVAFAPMVASHHPRVIAVGEGNGELLRVTLLIPDVCRGPSAKKLSGFTKMDALQLKSLPGILASTLATVEVDFTSNEQVQRPDTVQNDDIMARGSMRGGLNDMSDILLRFPLKDENNHEPTVQARQHGKTTSRNIGNRFHGKSSSHMTSMEIGMYVLLAAFCFAIAIFVVSCIVYASKLKPTNQELAGLAVNGQNQNGNSEVGMNPVLGLNKEKIQTEPTTNAHDWVWLGRATLDRKGHPANQTSAPNDNEMHITNNPLNYNYVDPDDAIRNESSVIATSFDNPNSIELPSANSNRKVIDTKTYCKRPAKHIRNNSNGNGKCLQNEDSKDYRPPVPPHRATQANRAIPERKNILADTIMPPPRRGHYRNKRIIEKENPQTRRISQSPENRQWNRAINVRQNASENTYELNDNYEPQIELLMEKMQSKGDCSGMFEFENDAPVIIDNQEFHDITGIERETEDSKRTFTKPKSPEYSRESGLGFSEIQRRKIKTRETNRNGQNMDDFVEQVNQNNGDTEVRRATIVGNKMFSICNGEIAKAQEQLYHKDVEPLDLGELQMDYDQIMHYFHNLKESNA